MMGRFKQELWLVYGLIGGIVGIMLYNLYFDLRFLHVIRVMNDIRVVTGK